VSGRGPECRAAAITVRLVILDMERLRMGLLEIGKMQELADQLITWAHALAPAVRELEKAAGPEALP
jgi:hypothetical protein